ncbi:NAD(+)/NADH kinase [bacterium]|nr:NAD(+)/NADH kinase [bacterium]MBU1072761.1 NAD(+)/NADH kinase [bacterium]MBU1675149.1 NAD(+)/NADH kinase [bacterium]
MGLTTIGLFGNPEKEEIGGAIAHVIERSKAEGIATAAQRELAALVDAETRICESAELARVSDVIITLGGDGTMLRAARSLDDSDTPLLGINLGALGYLTDVPLSELDDALDQLISGDYTSTPRARVLGVVQRDGEEVARCTALNDIVVNMGPLPRALHMEVRLDNVTLGRFLGDGLIVSTSTGSTAYNLSAGGPIIHPGVSALVVNPICPHSLAIRPLLVPIEKTVELRLHYVGRGATLTADGQEATPLQEGDRIVYRRADEPVYLVKFPSSDFFRAMQSKLQWGAINRRQTGP